MWTLRINQEYTSIVQFFFLVAAARLKEDCCSAPRQDITASSQKNTRTILEVGQSLLSFPQYSFVEIKPEQRFNRKIYTTKPAQCYWKVIAELPDKGQEDI